MKRLVLTVAMLALPVAAAAQVPPPPPGPPPAPPVPVIEAPLPPLPPVPPLPPIAVRAPVYIDEYAIQEAVRAAREMRVDVEGVREQARIAAEAVRIDVEMIKEQAKAAADQAKMALKPDFDFDFKWSIQDRMFTTSFGQEGDANYSSGQSHLGQRQYDQAIIRFDRVIAARSSRADAAHYYKAFAQFRLGRTDDALATIAALRKEYPQSRYLTDAKVLEADARRLKPQDIVDDDEIKLLAIGAMQQAEAERAIPLAEEVLNRNNSLAVKKRALYILALKSDNPRARQILLSYAKGQGNPDLQLEAIRYIAQNRDKQTTAADLQQIYQATQDTSVKLAIINAFRQSGNTPALVTIANSPNAPIEIRRSAVSGIASPQDLWPLYQKEENKELRLQMISAFGSMHALDQLNQILKTEKDPELRRRAVRSLGSFKSDQTGKMLVDMYGSEQDIETRKAVINALGSQNNAEALVSIARKESNQSLKLDIVRRLTEMASRSKVAADYLMELIKG
jgi:HEAT repeat protein